MGIELVALAVVLVDQVLVVVGRELQFVVEALKKWTQRSFWTLESTLDGMVEG